MGIFGKEEPSFSSDFSSDINNELDSKNEGGIDVEFQDFLRSEKLKAEVQAQIHEFNDLCWEKCYTEKPGSKISGKTETCLTNCVDRFIDKIKAFNGNLGCLLE